MSKKNIELIRQFTANIDKIVRSERIEKNTLLNYTRRIRLELSKLQASDSKKEKHILTKPQKRVNLRVSYTR